MGRGYKNRIVHQDPLVKTVADWDHIISGSLHTSSLQELGV